MVIDMMFESCVLYGARRKVEKTKNKDILLDMETRFGLIGNALVEMDKVQSKPIKPLWDYAIMAKDRPDFQRMLNKLDWMHKNLGEKKFDTDLRLDEKRKIMQNSIDTLHLVMRDLRENHKYDKFEKDKSDDNEEQLRTADYMISTLSGKLEEHNYKELTNILNSMKKIELNFILEYEGLTIYPIVADILSDFIIMEFAWDVDKALIDKIRLEWKGAVEAQKERNFFNYTAFTKMELIETVKRDNLRRYLLSEYHRVLNVDKQSLRTFMQHIIYHDRRNHKNTPSKEFDIINTIPKRPFLLEKTKIIIGGE